MFRLLRIGSMFVVFVMLTGCHSIAVTHRPRGPVVAHRPGPPPHAPAHGHRDKHRGDTQLRFDSEVGVYVVVRQRDIYFHDGWFIRIRNGGWQASATLEGPWKRRAIASVPQGLRAKTHRGRGAAKSKWKHKR